MSQKSSAINRLRHLEAFSAILSQGSISAAARKLGISQPAVSQLIKALEDEAGRELLIRDKNAIRPTRFALALEEKTTELLAQVEMFQQLLKCEPQVRKLRFGICPDLPSDLIEELLSVLLSAAPQSLADVHYLPSDAAAEAVRTDEIDVAFHFGRDFPVGINSIKLYETRLVLGLRADHPFALRESVFLQDLSGLRVLAPSQEIFQQITEKWTFDAAPPVHLAYLPSTAMTETLLGRLDAVALFQELSDNMQESPLVKKTVLGLDAQGTIFASFGESAGATDILSVLGFTPEEPYETSDRAKTNADTEATQHEIRDAVL